MSYEYSSPYKYGEDGDKIGINAHAKAGKRREVKPAKLFSSRGAKQEKHVWDGGSTLGKQRIVGCKRCGKPKFVVEYETCAGK